MAVLMIDGLDVAGSCVVVALVITTDGTKVPSDSGWATPRTRQSSRPVGRPRGPGPRRGVRRALRIDGAKALAAGIKKVFGDDAVVQRCVLHKRRNVEGYLPKELGGTVDKRLG